VSCLCHAATANVQGLLHVTWVSLELLKQTLMETGMEDAEPLPPPKSMKPGKGKQKGMHGQLCNKREHVPKNFNNDGAEYDDPNTRPYTATELPCSSGRSNCYCLSGRCRAVEQLNEQGEVIASFCSAVDAARKVGGGSITNSMISMHCNGRTKVQGNYWFRFRDPPIVAGVRKTAHLVALDPVKVKVKVEGGFKEDMV